MTTERQHARARLSWAGLCLSLALGACAGGPPRVASDLEADIPANLRADYQSFRDNCSKCHSLDRPLQAHVDEVAHWDVYVAKMMRTAGSAISKVESPKILRFLYWYTERRNRLKAEAKRAKQTVVTEEEEKAPATEPAAAPAPLPVQSSTPAPAPTTTPVSEPVSAPTQSLQGEGAP
jgi:cell division septation protein DedD